MHTPTAAFLTLFPLALLLAPVPAAAQDGEVAGIIEIDTPAVLDPPVLLTGHSTPFYVAIVAGRRACLASKRLLGIPIPRPRP